MITRRSVILAVGSLCAAPSFAADFPARAVRIIIPFPPGGSTDVGARMIAAKLAADFKQPVIVENKPGAGTTIASAYVATSPPDGYTLYVTGPGTHVVAESLYKKVNYNALTSFAPVGMINTSPFVVVVNPASPYKTLAQLFDAAKAAPNKLSYGSTGNGALPHLATEIILRAAGAQATHIPYQGAGPAMTALLAGQIDFMVSDVGAVPFVKGGKLRALAVTTARGSDHFQGVPSLAAAGLPGLDMPSGLAMLAPAGTPADVVQIINAAMQRALRDKDVEEKFALQGFDPAPGTPAELGRFLTAESERYGRVVKELGIALD